jgi:hypothetical protein
MRITQGASKRPDRRVHTVLEINEGVGGPQTILQFFSSEQFPGLFKQQCENLKGPAGQTHLPTVFAELARTEVNVVGVEAEPTLKRKLVAHGRSCEAEVYSACGWNSRKRSAKRYKYRNVSVLAVYPDFTNKGLVLH